MNVTIALLTYNRRELFQSTLESIKQTEHPYKLVIYDNGSKDGTADIVRSLGGVVNDTDNHTVGHGMNKAIGLALDTNPDLIVFTADDYTYQAGWFERLVSFWQDAPADIIMSCNCVESLWQWNEVTGFGEAGGVRYVTRTSIPGSNWTFRPETASRFMPLPEKTGGEDLEVCRMFTEQGYRLAELNLSEHTGEKMSSWGNESWKRATPFDFERYGI